MTNTETKLPRAVICAAMLAAAAFTAPAAGTVPYVNAGENLLWWGTGKSETYDVAAFIGPEFKGAQIRKVSFRAAADPEISGFSVWLSGQLRLDGGKNAPDVLSASVEPEEGTVSLTLSEPYTVGDAGVYIGYSFTVAKRETEAQKQPVAVARGGDADRHGLYVHSSRTYSKWTASAAGQDAFLPFETVLGGLPDHAVALTLPSEINVAAGDAAAFEAVITNFGTAGASSVEVEWSAGGDGGRIPVALSAPLPALYRASVPLTVPLPPVASAGKYGLRMKVAAADGGANAYSGPEAEAALNVWRWLPKRRPLLEEYTGTGCGYCPRGAVGMEKMTALHGDDFVGVAYHHADVMSIFTPEEYPNPAPAQPVAWLDRTVETDIYFGDLPLTSKTFGFDAVWTREAARFTPADLSLSCAWTDETRKEIKADAEATFVKAFDGCDFRLSYILVADGLKGEGRGWSQGNYYSGQTGKWPEDFDWLVESPNPIQGMVYDHVAILYPSPEGIAGSVPSSIEEGQTVSHSQTLSLADAVNLEGTPLVQDGLAYSVVAVLTDASTGETLNCAKRRVGDAGAVAGTEADAPVEVRFADLLGRTIPCPPKAGIYVEIRRYADGRRVARKMAAAKAIL